MTNLKAMLNEMMDEGDKERVKETLRALAFEATRPKRAHCPHCRKHFDVNWPDMNAQVRALQLYMEHWGGKPTMSPVAPQVPNPRNMEELEALTDEELELLAQQV